MFLQRKMRPQDTTQGRRKTINCYSEVSCSAAGMLLYILYQTKNAKQLKICKVYKNKLYAKYEYEYAKQNRGRKTGYKRKRTKWVLDMYKNVIYVYIPLQIYRNACYKRCNALTLDIRVKSYMSIMSSICGPSEGRQTIVCC